MVDDARRTSSVYPYCNTNNSIKGEHHWVEGNLSVCKEEVIPKCMIIANKNRATFAWFAIRPAVVTVAWWILGVLGAIEQFVFEKVTFPIE